VSSHGEFNVSHLRLSLNLPWLEKLNAEIVEIPGAHPDSTTLLYDADIQILVTSPLSNPIPRDIESLLARSGSFLILNYPTLDQRIADFTLSRLTSLSTALSGTLRHKLLHAYPLQALSALDIFRQASNSAEAIQAFQDDFLGSGVTALSQSIARSLSLDEEARRGRHAQLVLTGALAACRDTVERMSRDAAAVQAHIEELQSRVDNAHNVSVQDVLGDTETSHVGEAIQRSMGEVRTTMDALQWWKLPFKVDDLGETLTRAVERAWCRDLEAKVPLLCMHCRVSQLTWNHLTATIRNGTTFVPALSTDRRNTRDSSASAISVPFGRSYKYASPARCPPA